MERKVMPSLRNTPPQRDVLINALLVLSNDQVLYENLPSEVRDVCRQAAEALMETSSANVPEAEVEKKAVIEQLGELMAAWGNNQLYFESRAVVFRAWQFLKHEHRLFAQSATTPTSEAMAALRELVALKGMKDELERTEPRDLSSPRNYAAEALREDYESRKPAAWDRARAVVHAADRGSKK